MLLKESADWDLDKDSSPMTSWDHVSNHFMNPTYIRFLFFFKGLPILGSFAKNALFNHLSYVYDVVLNYVNAHEIVEGIADTVRGCFTGLVLIIIFSSHSKEIFSVLS